MSLTIKARIGITMLCLGALMTITGKLDLVGMTRANLANHETFTNQLPSAVDIGYSEIFVGRERTALDRAALSPGTPVAEDLFRHAQDMRDQSATWWQKYLELPKDADEDRLAQNVATRRADIERGLDAFRDAIRTADHDKILDRSSKLSDLNTALSSACDALKRFQFEAAQKSYDNAQTTFTLFRVLSIGMLLFGLVAATYSWFALRRAIGTPLAIALAHFDEIATGDLRRSVQVTSHDEMGQLLAGLARMHDSLVTTVRTVRDGGVSIALASKEIAAGNLDLSSRTEEQAASLQETAASMEQLTGTVRQNADNARHASTLASNASDVASRGSEVVARVVGTMSEIDKSSSKIADIIGMIEGIAFQTNILALNAAVEAARAGEQGRGFAVVAAEVRSLAQRSSTAAKEIRDLIETSTARVQTGTELVGQAGATMQEIISAVSRVTDIMGEIAAASDEQSRGIEQIGQAVTQMDDVTQQNAALVEQATAAAQSLEHQATKLKDVVALFTLDHRDALT
ncbi:HAMP domain-containing protein [Paraburkholderia sp. RP-4-7]|uniref:HAMP domain-containing protein n=1 Tax=Paraburkholderia polaris TaxID=2728848 RepID=A0A848I8G3_9BURK|nr:methyl-accepting chemotaxis protein [Paraburkholderia polaris]NML97719.1 HAMP domain-containing protein [Paraburkholderia polaris]